MKSALTTRARGRLTRLSLGLAMLATLALTATQWLPSSPAAHAAALHAPAALYDGPQITVNDEFWGPNNPHVFPVVGFYFTVNSPVLLELVGTSGTVVTEAVTTARGGPLAGAFRYSLTIPAAFQLPGSRLFAIDRATGRRSNIIAFHYPIPNCIRHPYTCV